MFEVSSNQNIHAYPLYLNPFSLPTPFCLPLISEPHPSEEVMKLENGERKNGGGVVGRWKQLPTHLGEMDDDQRHFCFYSQHQHSECFIYPMPAEGQCVIHNTCPLLFFLYFLQELIEVDSEVVFELASYIVQVRINVFVFCSVCVSDFLLFFIFEKIRYEAKHARCFRTVALKWCSSATLGGFFVSLCFKWH